MSGTDKIDLRAYRLDASDVTATAAGADTILSVDVNGDTIADFTITLVNAGAPVSGDYLL